MNQPVGSLICQSGMLLVLDQVKKTGKIPTPQHYVPQAVINRGNSQQRKPNEEASTH